MIGPLRIQRYDFATFAVNGFGLFQQHPKNIISFPEIFNESEVIPLDCLSYLGVFRTKQDEYYSHFLLMDSVSYYWGYLTSPSDG